MDQVEAEAAERQRQRQREDRKRTLATYRARFHFKSGESEDVAQMTVLRILLALALIVFVSIILALAALPAGVQERLQSARPQGFFGEGHDKFHGVYQGLVNGARSSCCNGADGRPTQAKWNNATGTWDVMIDGAWRTMLPGEAYKILTPDVFAAQGRERWDSLAHVFTSKDGKTIYCLVPPASGG